MFNTNSDCYGNSTSSSGLVFNRTHQNSRYHPYHRISSSFYQNNELDSYNFDNNLNGTHSLNSHHHGSIQNYDHSNLSYDYNIPWTGSSSSMDHELSTDGQINSTSNNLTGTGRVE